MSTPIRVLVAGCGNMGASHARAYHRMPEFEIVGLVSRGPASRERLSAELGGLPGFSDYYAALAATRPDAVSINTYPETHGPYARAALDAGCHVFCEKPLAETVEEAQSIVDAARARNCKLVIGYILRVHPAWVRFIEMARTLGKPLVMRMNLNQQSRGTAWQSHRNLMESMSPIVDCGVHYVDVMCQMTGARPVRVSAVGARLTDDIKADMYNYGQLQVTFDDGSVGWYEAGWGPMVSEVAFFVKDVIGPKGCVSIVKDPNEAAAAASDDIDSHTKTNSIRLHHAELTAAGEFARPDEYINTEDEPDHQGLCDREQAFFLRAIRENVDLSAHMHDAVNSLRIVLAADESVRTGQVVTL
ncbi:MAG TPA: Gfo/Idh/MocA family oxidoreductase [Vicinamibacterales bacterium]|nr:Gfo/Idh/MocA family oxidoreductase [Vicinamibacterales bacterium]